jgi:hypothetical protein
MPHALVLLLLVGLTSIMKQKQIGIVSFHSMLLVARLGFARISRLVREGFRSKTLCNCVTIGCSVNATPKLNKIEFKTGFLGSLRINQHAECLMCL